MSTSPSDRDRALTTLDYGRPRRQITASSVFAGLFGFLAALASLPAWGVGIYGVIYALFIGFTADRLPNLCSAGIVLAVAIICTIAAIYWLRDAFGTRGS